MPRSLKRLCASCGAVEPDEDFHALCPGCNEEVSDGSAEARGMWWAWGKLQNERHSLEEWEAQGKSPAVLTYCRTVVESAPIEEQRGFVLHLFRQWNTEELKRFLRDAVKQIRE